jgi:hypothetical protein
MLSMQSRLRESGFSDSVASAASERLCKYLNCTSTGTGTSTIQPDLAFDRVISRVHLQLERRMSSGSGGCCDPSVSCLYSTRTVLLYLQYTIHTTR